MDFETDADRLATIQACGGELVTVGSASVWAVFEAPYEEQLETEGSLPTLTCRTSDVTSAAHGTAVVRAGTNYTVRGVQPDGTGITVLRIEEAD